MRATIGMSFQSTYSSASAHEAGASANDVDEADGDSVTSEAVSFVAGIRILLTVRFAVASSVKLALLLLL
jgi:hypothetical protein